MKRFLHKLMALLLLFDLFFSSACASEDVWFCKRCFAYRNTLYCPDCGMRKPLGCEADNTSYYSNDPYDMGIPNLYGKTIKKDQMNLIVLWVQKQLKATGIYYQGEIWDETGHLGDHTMEEVASFMQSRGYKSHGGQIDQTVINNLADYLGYRVVPVYVGGFYTHMDSIMYGGHMGNMQAIISNLRDMIPHVTVGARWVQCCLKKLGYYNGVIDGKYGEATENAVKSFQKTFGFEQRDYVTLGVARTMLEQCYYSGCNLEDLP